MADSDVDPLAISPVEDGGAVATDGFVFQHDCIAYLAIKMLNDDSIVEIVCETHEDAIVRFADGSAELVSCKARDQGAPFTVPTLLTDGGLRKLFESWYRTGRSCRCHLMTDGEFAKGSQAPKLVAACERRDLDAVKPWAEDLAGRLETDVATAATFLAVFRATTSKALGLRAHTAGINASRLRGWLRERRLDQTLDGQCYALLREYVADRCRAATADPLDTASLLEMSRVPGSVKDRDRIVSRTLDRRSVSAAMLAAPTGRTLLTGDPASLDHTRLTIKLERGLVPHAVVSAARALRVSWYEFEAAQALRAPGMAPALIDVRTRTLLVVADAVNRFPPDEPFGRELYSALRHDLTTDALAPLPVLGLSNELLLGLVFQATDECDVFWSPPFDVDAALA